LTREVKRGVVDPQVLLESTNQLKSSTASKGAAQATITKAEADLISRQAAAAKAKVSVQVATAALAVAESDARRMKAWVGYLTLTAPFDGVIVARNANTGDFVLPATGDPSALQRAPDISTAGAAPIYVVDRTDVVRIFVDIPEQDANYVNIGNKASVLARAYRDKEIAGEVKRTSWALNVKSRTLRAEIDLPNPGSQLLPGMYAYAKVIIERPDVRTLPVTALIHSGEQTYCLTHQKGRAVRTEIQTGVNDGEWIEVTNRRVPASQSTTGLDPWVPVDGTEEVILGDLSILTDGTPVQIEAAKEGAKIAVAIPELFPAVKGENSGPAPRVR
jgi:multidrug efflux pump subunit AcrA (membrane-fusion protein)